MQDKYLASHFTACAYAVEEQEIAQSTSLARDSAMKEKHQPLRHDPVAKAIYLEHTNKNANTKVRFRNENEFIEKIGDYEFWWNVPIKASTKLPHNKPDILIWNKKTKTCSAIEISYPADVNITRKTNEKLQKYAPLLRNLLMMYSD